MDELRPEGRRRAVSGGPLDGKPFEVTGYEVWVAWQKVRGNKGAPGVDAVSIAAFEERLEDNLYKVWNRMAAGSYFPPPVRAVEIPKAGGGTRGLGVPTVGDRVAQTVAASRIEEFPDCPFERYADDGMIHCKSEARARQVLAALELRMEEVGLRLHPEKTRIIYCKDANRRGPWAGPVSFDFLGYTFRPRSSTGKNGRFTGFDLAVSDKAVKRMSETVSGWQLHRHVNLTWEQLAGWISPVIQGWMAYYGKFRKSGLYSLLARINYYLRKWVRAKYKRLRPVRAMLRAWERVTAQYPGLLPHWRWVTGAWY